jgi:methionine synthase / methylenetetrahydrofolate reductase(NADPH)
VSSSSRVAGHHPPGPDHGPADDPAHLQQHAGVETIATVVTWDKTIMTLQADLLGAHALGIRSVICTTGSPPVLGDYPAVDGIWEVDSLGLIGLLSGLNAGRDSNGLATASNWRPTCSPKPASWSAA